MKKPTLQTRKSMDYHTCAEFIDEKYNCDIDDYKGLFGKGGWHERHNYKIYENETGDMCPFAGNWTTAQYNENKELISAWQEREKAWLKPRHEKDPEPEFLCFWHWIVDSYQISNGTYFTFIEDEPPRKDWQKEIFMRFIEEFGVGEKGNREIEFYVAW